MTWVKIDDKFPDHPKVIEAGPLAGWLYICGLAYANRYLTDGFVPERQVNRLCDVDGVDELATDLVRVGLWEIVEGGYQIHDYLEYQPSAEKVRAERDAARERMANKRGSSVDVQENFARTSPEVQLPRPVPVPVPNTDQKPVPEPDQHVAPAGADMCRERFAQFWVVYPRKTAKQDAEKAFRKVNPDGDLFAAMMAALEAQKNWDQWLSGVVPHPATWLNARRWEDEEPPPRFGTRPIAQPSQSKQQADYLREQIAQEESRERNRSQEDRTDAPYSLAENAG